MSPDPILRTPRLVWPYVSDPELPRFMTWDAHTDLAQTEGFIAAVAAERAAGKGLVFALIHDGAVAGLAGLHGITRTQAAWRMDRAELGYWIGPPYQNRGLISEAARAVLCHAFQELGLHKVTVGCITDNVPSRRVIEKLGFRLIGEQRDHMFRYGRWWNHLAYELCVDEWRP
jgi:ribosomal-protein-serine acetyltransferase